MISFEKLSTQAPDLIKRYNTAKNQFEGLGQAAVYLAVDVSGSMQQLFKNGVVQDLAERVLGLSAVLDDDGIVPTVFFNTRVRETHSITIGQHHGFMSRIAPPNGGTQFSPAMRSIIQHYQLSETRLPAIVLFQTDGDQEDEEATSKLLVESCGLPIFWQFLGMGRTRFPRLSRLDTLAGRIVDNADLIIDPCRTQNGKLVSILDDNQLYGQLSSNYERWLYAAKRVGIL